MSVFYHEEPPNPHKKCKYLVTCLKDAFSNCHIFGGQLPTSSPEEDYQSSDFDYEHEVLVSVIRGRAMEKLRKKSNSLTNSFSLVYSPVTRELNSPATRELNSPVTREMYITENEIEKEEEQEREEFLSVKSDFSCCSSIESKDVFVSVKTSLSRCSSFKAIDFKAFQRRSIIQEFCHCEGWPFGLCRKAVLLPPLPKSPSESWSWNKDTKLVRMIKN